MTHRWALVGVGAYGAPSHLEKENPCHCFGFQDTGAFLAKTIESTAPVFREQKNLLPQPK